jgi:MFS family permease
VWLFTFSRAFQSLGLGNTGLMLATLAEHAPPNRTGLAFGLVNGANPVGAFLGPLVGGPIVDRFGLPPLLILDALVIAVVVALLVFGYRDVFVPRPSGEHLLRMAWDGVLLIARSPRLRTLFPAYFVLFSGWLMAYIYIPLIVSRVYTGPDTGSAIGLILGGGGLATLIATPLIGAIADRIGHWRTLFLGSAAMCVLWVLPYFARDIVTLGVLWAVANGMVSGVFSVSFNVLSSSTTDATRGRVMTFGYLPGNMGFVIGPGIGALVASVDVFLVFPAAALLTAIGLAAIFYSWRQPVES